MSPSYILDLKEHELEAAGSGTITLDQILEKRKNYLEQNQARGVNRLVNILIVPGHDDESWGTEFQGMREVELNRDISKRIHEHLLREGGINSVLASDESGYNVIFKKYFQREKRGIEDFIKNSKKSFSRRAKRDDLEIDTGFHNAASESVAFRLYGINRWVNAQDFDLVIHVHFNDYRGREWNTVGEYSGFSIYAPGENFENHELGRSLADSIFSELKKVQPVSNFESESGGIVETHELIAIGSNETLDAGSVLVEYGYIYEDNFRDSEKRDVALDNFAYATYSGIKKLMNEVPSAKTFEAVTVTEDEMTIQNLKWQFQKAWEGSYPPEGKTLEDCPISGYFGECSKNAK